jgi:hypothetical protein
MRVGDVIHQFERCAAMFSAKAKTANSEQGRSYNFGKAEAYREAVEYLSKVVLPQTGQDDER